MALSQRDFLHHSYEMELRFDPDDELCGSEQGSSYETSKRKIIDTITSAQKMIREQEFINLVQKDCKMLSSIDEDLKIRHQDMKRDCAIVFAGEASAGKSTIINLIIGENIVPVKIHASTRKVCRIKYSEKLKVSLFNAKDTLIEEKFFDNKGNMKTYLESTIESTNRHIKIVDIWYPVKILERYRTCTIVDTPGIGDKEQDDVAEIMMQYIPNALAFVFVVNANVAGGLQADRIQVIFERIKENMEKMVSFDPSDVIFLLNKWDALIFGEESEEMVFKTMKQNICNLWEDAKDEYILKSAGGRVPSMDSFKGKFEMFIKLLNLVISQKAKRRVEGHVQFLKEFLGNCEITISRKLQTTKYTAEENQRRLRFAEEELEKLIILREEAYSNPQRHVEHFLEETAKQLVQYIHQPSFQKEILKDMNKYMRVQVVFLLDSRIKEKIGTWEQHNIRRIFEEIVMKPISDKLTSIYDKLNAIKKYISGIEPPFDADDKIMSVLAGFIAPSGSGFLASFLLTRFMALAVPGGAIMALGFLIGSLVSTTIALDLTSDFDTFCIHAFNVRIHALTKEKIKKSHRDVYAAKSVELIKALLDGQVKEEIDDLNEHVKKMGGQLNLFKAQKKSLHSLNSRIQEIKRHFYDSD